MSSNLEPEKDTGAPKLPVTREELDRFAAARKSHEEREAKALSETERNRPPDPHGPVRPEPTRWELDQLIALFGSILGLGSFFLLPLRYALLTLSVALLTVSSRIRDGRRWGAVAIALCALVATAVVWTSGSKDEAKLVDEQARAKVRLEIVDEVNGLRLQHHLEPLNYDPALSLVAQQRADFGAAAHSGFATDSTAGPLPSSETNVWAEMAGVSCTWEHLFEIDGSGDHSLGPDPELGFIENKDPGSHVRSSYLSPKFSSIGVGVEALPDENISLVMDFIGRPDPAAPWTKGMPNLLGEVVGVGLPDCS